jgi:hypothetical protein
VQAVLGDGYSCAGTRLATSTRSPRHTRAATGADHGSEAKKFTFSVLPIERTENGAGGSLLLGFHAKNRLVAGLQDGFLVKITS